MIAAKILGYYWIDGKLNPADRLEKSTPVDAFRAFDHLNLTNIDEDTRFPVTIIQTVCCKDGNNSPTACPIYTTGS
jgi:hypothetical protein